MLNRTINVCNLDISLRETLIKQISNNVHKLNTEYKVYHLKHTYKIIANIQYSQLNFNPCIQV